MRRAKGDREEVRGRKRVNRLRESREKKERVERKGKQKNPNDKVCVKVRGRRQNEVSRRSTFLADKL